MPSKLLRLRRDGDDLEDSALHRALVASVDGEVRFDRGTRALYATDASNYRLPPLGVVIPRSVDAAIAALAICHEYGAPVLPRGGGTSLGGQCCNRAVVIDCSRHLDRIELDRETGVARVQPGVVLDALKQVANRHDWDFGPDPSTHDRCTLGGMLGNNSCGTHSVMSEFYGPGPRTSDHVESLDVVTYDGVRLELGATDEQALRRAEARGGRVAEIYRRLVALRDRMGDHLAMEFARIPRRVSGYNLPELLARCGTHVGRSLVGSEATCALIVGATLKLVRSRPHRVLVVLAYPDIYEAADRVPEVRARKPVGCEALDHRLVDRLRQGGMYSETLELLPDGSAWLVVEHGADTLAEARAEAERTARRLGDGKRVAIFEDPAAQNKIWAIREAALAMTAMAAGEPDTWEGWEDSAVPPDRLGAYLRELERLLRAFQYHGALYGHFGQGCVHTRIDFDLASDAGVAKFQQFTNEAAKLVVGMGGSLSGEHGDGQARSDLLPLQYPPAVIDAFREFKAIWDPQNGMNPGRIVDARPRTDDLRIRDYHPRPGPIELVHADDGKDFGHAALRCVGVGKCRKQGAGTMCPSYMVTLDERHSTRGRAHLLFEMLHGELVEDGWRSEEVREALDLCLACKACKTECPVGVDMAAYKAEFLAHHYAGRLRPRHAYAFGWLHRWLVLGRPLARITNWATHAPGLGLLLKRIAGIDRAREIPRIARRSFRRDFATRGAGPPVIVWPDTFNDAFYPEVLHATVNVLAGAGRTVGIPRRRLCCGRPLMEFGWFDTVRRLWRRSLDELGPAIEARTPIVVAEPSCAAMFRDELVALLPDDPRAPRVAALARTLAEFLGDIDYEPARAAGPAIVHRHCHEAAVLGSRHAGDVLAAAGYDVDVLDSGCCGLAGPFGFEAGKLEISTALAERVLLPEVRAAPPGALIVTDGFSCREQLRQLADVRALHLAEALAVRGLTSNR